MRGERKSAERGVGVVIVIETRQVRAQENCCGRSVPSMQKHAMA